MTRWMLSSSSDPLALQIVDGTGPFAAFGPHYSRKTPGAKTFTGVGREVVLISDCGRAVWACLYQASHAKAGQGQGRHSQKGGAPPQGVEYLWRNMIFRNLGVEGVRSSDLIRDATDRTYEEWCRRYGCLPPERLRTEIGIGKVKSRNPGYCYLMAGWLRGETKNGKLFLYAPEP